MKRLKFLFFGLMIALLALLVLSASVSASSGAAPAAQETQAPDLSAFLQWLIGGGGSILAVSWLFERMPWFQNLSPDAKDYTIFGAAGAVGCAALAVIKFVPVEILTAISPFFLILATVFVGVFIAKTFHKADK